MEQVSTSPPCVRRMEQLSEHLANILAARPDPFLPEAIAQVAAIRSAARRVMEEEGLPREDRYALILHLAIVARDAIIADWARAAIWEETRKFYGAPVPAFPESSPRWEDAVRRLSKAGYSSCPACLTPLPTDLEHERSKRRRRWNEEDRATRRSAS